MFAAKSSVTGAFAELSLAKSSSKSRSSSSEAKGVLIVDLLVEGSTYSDHSFVCEIESSFLLPTDRRRLIDIRLVQVVE